MGNDPTVPNDGDSGFVDPCDPVLDRHLGRSTSGAIVGLTGLGRYLVENLNLRLSRHQCIWQLGKIEVLRGELDSLRQRLPRNSDVRSELAEEIADLFAEYIEYSRAVHDQ